MPTQLIIATLLFTLALILYSTAIWSERLAKKLESWHVFVLFLGVTADALGVWITYRLIGFLVLTPHAIFGFTALILMSLHFFWVLFIFITNNEQRTQRFHRFGLFVWSIWMLSYLSGFATGLQKII
jgi:uncharacterized repeat protein (TIGR03987 family)